MGHCASRLRRRFNKECVSSFLWIVKTPWWGIGKVTSGRETLLLLCSLHIQPSRDPACWLPEREGRKRLCFLWSDKKMGTSHWALICFCWVGLWRFAKAMHMCSLLTLYCSGSWTAWFKCCGALWSAAVTFTPWTVRLLLCRFTFLRFPRNPPFFVFRTGSEVWKFLKWCEPPRNVKLPSTADEEECGRILVTSIPWCYWFPVFWGKSCSMCSRIWAVWFLPARHFFVTFDQQSLRPFPHNILKSCFGKPHYYMSPMMQVKALFLRLWSPTENVCVQTEKYFEKAMSIPKPK